MFSEQLAVLLLVMANQVPDHGAMSNRELARLPAGGAERTAVQLKLDPTLSTQTTKFKFQRVGQRRRAENGTLFASN